MLWLTHRLVSLFVMTKDAFENKRSIGTEVAVMLNTSLANFAKQGLVLMYQATNA